MTQVAKPGAASGPPAEGVRRDAAERPAKGGEFETVLKEKGHEARPVRGGLAGDAALAGDARRAHTEDAVGERSRGEAADWRALPGDVAVPTGRHFDAGALVASDGARTAEAVARIERIAEQIVRAAELRLGPGGTAEARLQLDLGGLGQLRVALERNAEGAIAVRFEGAGPEAARRLVDHGAELVARLEARGLAVREVSLASPEGPVVRLGPAPEAPAADVARHAAGDPAASRHEADRGRQDEERQRRQAEPPAEDED